MTFVLPLLIELNFVSDPAVYPRDSSAFAHPVVFAVSEACKTRQYPDFILYPCRQYPDFNLYPPPENKDHSLPKTVARYGVFDLCTT